MNAIVTTNLGLFDFLVSMSALALPWLMGGGAVYIVSGAKKTLGTSGAWSYLILFVVALFMALLDMLVVGQIKQESFTQGDIYYILLSVITASQIHYRALRDKEKEAVQT